MFKLLVISAGFVAVSGAAFAQGSVSVRGYTRSDGTYVAPYTRSAPSTSGSSSGYYSAPSASNHSVSGYIKDNGTYVAPSRSTNPNSTTYDNYSTKGNVNPYTGKVGTKSPY